MSEGQAGDVRLLGRVRWQLVAWSGGVVLIVLLVLGITLYVAVARSLELTGIAHLRERADPLTRLIADPRFPSGGLGRGGYGFLFGGPGSGTFALVVGPGGDVVGLAGGDLPSGIPDREAVAAVQASGETDVRTGLVQGVPIRVLSEVVNRGGSRYVVQVIEETTAEQRTLGTLVGVLLVGGLLAVLVALGAGAVNASRALVPIRDALRRQREFAADASHELRTPLTVVRASVDHLRRNPQRPVADVGTALDDITAEVDQLTAMVDDLLLLARSDSGAIELASEPVDLGEVATDATGGLAGLAMHEDVRLALDPAPAEVTGDPLRLRQLVTILVDNAIRHGPGGGTVTVTVRPERDEVRAGRPGIAILTVDDEGPGIPPEDRQHVFDRFWRAPGATPGGTGLGLAIAAWIVERHRGTIAAADRPGGGARFVVRLPARAKT